MKLLKKSPRLFTCGVLALFLAVNLIGCSAGKGGTQENGQKTGAAVESKPSGPVKLTFLSGGSGMPASRDQDIVLKTLNQKLNMDLDFNVVTSEYDNMLNVRIAGGNPPDIFSLGRPAMFKLAGQSVLLELDSYMDKMPNVKKVFTKEEYNKGTVNGKIVALVKRPYAQYSSYWIRQDWLEKLGLAVPKTIDEFLEVARAFTDKDPDGNGKKDTYGVTGEGLTGFSPLFGAFGAAREDHFVMKDNKVVFSTMDPAYKEALTFINKVVTAGVVDPEMITNKNFAHREKAFKGQAGMVYIAWSDFVKGDLAAQMKAVNPNAKWIQIDPPAGPGGKFDGSVDMGSAPGSYAFSKELEKNKEKLNKALELFNYVTDGDGLKLVCYGLEGQHYKQENGKVVALPAMSEVSYSWNYQWTGRDELPYLYTKFAGLDAYITFAHELPRIKTYTGYVSIPDGMNITDMKKYEAEEILKFIYGKRPLSEYDKFIDTLKNTYQLQKYIDEAQKTLKELGYIK